VGESIIDIFKIENITGRSLPFLTREDIGAMGVRSMGDRVEIVGLIEGLKADWRITNGGMGSEVGSVAGRGSTLVMEDGKGILGIDAPPSYSA
jgi:hypothetical protein